MNDAPARRIDERGMLAGRSERLPRPSIAEFAGGGIRNLGRCEWAKRDQITASLRAEDSATFSAVMPRLDRGIQYAAASPHPTGVFGILGRPVKPGADKRRKRTQPLNAPRTPSAWSRPVSARAWRSPAARCPSRRSGPGR
ncbi:hypothetical protein E4K65_23820 [Bradyrhizobium niftali]|uniref:Uncharacterized protein n=1 Tax=Bradyrhizobium niftali TaxID=2560055 RepID=A0A4Y9LSW3_9BRAD|nr:hypothetical protein E4K65_23820 [Bradyrhizobium niftali]